MFILETLNFVVDILKVPSVLVGLIALIGLVAQKKSFSDVVKGTVKTILGFIVLGGGATVLVGSLNPLGGMFEHAFNIQGIIPNNEAIVSIALEKYGASTALIMAFGMGSQYYCRPFYAPEIYLPDRASHLLYGLHDRRDPHRGRL
ncbi:PTS system ascorbate-specific transporter subunit IIC [Raoultella planticola]|uniref:Ascorbate-specific PTS system EIIC component n=1 Tax=Raoultella planticola TaxID=575 RepID=A0A485C3P1_RAOPL|nr:PTS system ascorbate-specific transporter subunit IIC [Raoultella planticola]